MQRREFVKLAGLSLLAAGFSSTSSYAQSRFAKYKGTSLVISIPSHPHYDAMISLLPQFTALTGIKVELDKMQMLRMRDKQLLEMSKPQGDYDLVSYIATWKTDYVNKNLLRDLGPLFKDPQLADPGYDMADMVPAYLENIGLVGGIKGYLAGPGAKLYGVPYGAETSIFAYRRDLFAKYDLKVPQSYEDLHKLLYLCKDKAKIGALTSRGQAGHQCLQAWLLHLNPMGGNVFDYKSGVFSPVFNDDAGVKALAFLKDVVATGPVGIPSYGQGEMMTAFLEGQAAMYLDATAIFGPVRDKTRSRVSDKVGYAIHPKGTRYSSEAGGLGLAIPRNSKHAEAAFLLLQWLTAKEQDKAVCRAGGSPSRVSTIADPAMVKQFPEFTVLREQIKYINPDWRPMIPIWDEIVDQALGVGISNALIGSTSPSVALNGEVPKVLELMRQAGYKA
jgi:multiple sugar transport system substrate-binding protein